MQSTPDGAIGLDEAALEWLSRIAPGRGLLPETLEKASSDAGFRKYFRVRDAQSRTFILMDASKALESVKPFIRVGAILTRAGLHTPRILEADAAQGLMLLSDLGRETFLDALTRDPALAPQYFDAATTALVAMQAVSEPGLVPDYSEEKIRKELSLFPDWYVARQKGSSLDASERRAWDALCTALTDSMLGEGRVLVHRDFMPRNLMVSEPLPGVLDFQDALYGPVSYDIASLMRDAFISWDEAFTLDISVRYWEKARKAGIPVPQDFGAFWRNIEWTGLQRHLKVLGIFARLKFRDGKDKYIADAPRFIAYARHTASRYERLRPLLAILDRLEGVSGKDVWTY